MPQDVERFKGSMPRKAPHLYPPLVAPVQGPLEPQMTFDLRWVHTTPYHPDEPTQRLQSLRSIKNKNPGRFYAMYTEWHNKYEAILAKANQSAEPAKDGLEDVEHYVALCENLIAEYLEKEKAK